MKDVIISVIVVFIIIIVTVCGSYYFVTKYNIDKENEAMIRNSNIVIENK